jgi:hypothetical protein
MQEKAIDAARESSLMISKTNLTKSNSHEGQFILIRFLHGVCEVDDFLMG